MTTSQITVPRTYTVRESHVGGGWVVVSAPVSDKYDVRYEVGPFTRKGLALAEANLLASQAPGNRVES